MSEFSGRPSVARVLSAVQWTSEPCDGCCCRFAVHQQVGGLQRDANSGRRAEAERRIESESESRRRAPKRESPAFFFFFLRERDIRRGSLETSADVPLLHNNNDNSDNGAPFSPLLVICGESERSGEEDAQAGADERLVC